MGETQVDDRFTGPAVIDPSRQVEQQFDELAPYVECAVADRTDAGFAQTHDEFTQHRNGAVRVRLEEPHERGSIDDGGIDGCEGSYGGRSAPGGFVERGDLPDKITGASESEHRLLAVDGDTDDFRPSSAHHKYVVAVSAVVYQVLIAVERARSAEAQQRGPICVGESIDEGAGR